MMQLAKGLRVPPEVSATLAAELQRLKWFLWHGSGFRSLHTVDDITTDLEDQDTGGQQDKDRQDKLAKAVREFGGYLGPEIRSRAVLARAQPAVTVPTKPSKSIRILGDGNIGRIADAQQPRLSCGQLAGVLIGCPSTPTTYQTFWTP